MSSALSEGPLLVLPPEACEASVIETAGTLSGSTAAAVRIALQHLIDAGKPR